MDATAAESRQPEPVNRAAQSGGALRPASELDSGDTRALFAALYAELHRLAQRRLAGSASGQLGATTLLHEAYMKLANGSARAFPDYAHFLAYAGRAMRTIIIDRARSANAGKRGAGVDFTTLGDQPAAGPAAAADVERMGAALDELGTVDPELAKVVDLKFFCGLSFAEIAALQATSERTVQRKWERARIYLHHVLQTR